MSMTDALRELDDEVASIDALLTELADGDWSKPTPAEGWSVQDQVSHLADTNEIAVDTMTGGTRSLNVEAGRYASPEAFTQAGVDRGRAMKPEDVLAWWRATEAAMRAAFETLDPKQRVPWGLGMQARTLVTARLMEHWAHATDIRRALGAPIELTPRLHSVAWLVLNAIPYALTVAGVERPGDARLRVELQAGDETWRIGPEDAGDVIRGDALAFCLTGIQRMTAEESGLEAIGPYARTVLPHLRAYL